MGAVNRVDLSSANARVLGKILRQQAESVPDATYLMAGERRFSFGRVNEIANAYAAGFRGLGVQPGDTVALLMAGSPELVFTTLGVNKLGAVWVPTNTDYRKEWLRGALRDSRARVLVVDATLLPRLAELGPPLPCERIVVNGKADVGIEGAIVDLAEFAQIRAGEPDVDVSHSDT